MTLATIVGHPLQNVASISMQKNIEFRLVLCGKLPGSLKQGQYPKPGLGKVEQLYCSVATPPSFIQVAIFDEPNGKYES